MMDKPAIIMFLILVVLTVVEYLWTPHHYPVFPWHHIPGFMGLVGLIACLVVVIVGKSIGKSFLQRPEDFDD